MNEEFLDSLSGHVYIVNCSHRNWFWRLIGHTALLYKHGGFWKITESTAQRKPKGVGTINAFKWNYKGRIYLRQVMLDGFDIEDVCELTHDITKEYDKHPYPSKWDGFKKLICASLDINIGGTDIAQHRGEDKGIFCTQWVVMIGQLSGWVKWIYDCREVKSKEFEPDDMRNGKIEQFMNCQLGPEFEVK